MKIILNHNPIGWVKDQISDQVNEQTNSLKAQAKEQVQEWVLGGLEALRDITVDLSYSAALVGGGICILLFLSGWKDGKRWAGILFMSNVLIRFLFGGHG